MTEYLVRVFTKHDREPLEYRPVKGLHNVQNLLQAIQFSEGVIREIHKRDPIRYEIFKLQAAFERNLPQKGENGEHEKTDFDYWHDLPQTRPQPYPIGAEESDEPLPKPQDSRPRPEDPKEDNSDQTTAKKP